MLVSHQETRADPQCYGDEDAQMDGGLNLYGSRDEWRCSKMTPSCPSRNEDEGSVSTVVWTHHAQWEEIGVKNTPPTRPCRLPTMRKAEEAVDGCNHWRNECSGSSPRGLPRPIQMENTVPCSGPRAGRMLGKREIPLWVTGASYIQ